MFKHYTGYYNYFALINFLLGNKYWIPGMANSQQQQYEKQNINSEKYYVADEH